MGHESLLECDSHVPPMVRRSLPSRATISCSSMLFCCMCKLFSMGWDRQVAMGHESASINVVHCSRFFHYDTVFDIGVEHLQELYGMLAYYAFLCNGTIKLHPLRVMVVYSP